MDEDIEKMTEEDAKNEVRRLREGIRNHRDASGHDLCWYHPELWDYYLTRLSHHQTFRRYRNSFITARSIGSR